jgi:hypothetical protein
MSDWLHNLPVLWTALVVFGVTYLIAASIYAGVNALAVGERARAFKAVSPGILSSMGIVRIHRRSGLGRHRPCECGSQP